MPGKVLTLDSINEPVKKMEYAVCVRSLTALPTPTALLLQVSRSDLPGTMPGTLYRTTAPPWHEAGNPTRAWHFPLEGSGTIRTAHATVCVATSSSDQLLAKRVVIRGSGLRFFFGRGSMVPDDALILALSHSG